MLCKKMSLICDHLGLDSLNLLTDGAISFCMGGHIDSLLVALQVLVGVG